MKERVFNDYLGSFVVKLSPSLLMEAHVIEHGVWESPSVWVFEQCIKSGDYCIDIGANSGLLSLAIAKQVGAEGRVFCFEPSASIYPRLVDNINLNPAWRAVFSHEKMGLGDCEGHFVLKMQGDGNGRITEPYNLNDAEFDGELCVVSTLDALFNTYPKIDFIKIDVEGMEHAVLKGGINSIRKHQPHILYESELEHGWFDQEDVKGCEDLLRSEGYELYKVHPDGKLIPVTYPDYEVNSLAIHRDKISAIEHVL